MMQLAALDQSIDKYQLKLEKLDVEIKKLVIEKKKTQAKAKIAEAQQIRSQFEDIENKKNVLTNMRIKLEMATSDKNIIGVIKDVNKIME